MRPDWQDRAGASVLGIVTPVLALDGTVFAGVLFAVVAVGVVVAVICGLAGRDAYDEVGGGGLWPPPEGGRSAAAEDEGREEEIGQMQAALRARRSVGPPTAAPEPPPAADPGLAEEIRQLTEAGNALRRRQGRQPLDVEAEVARRLREPG